MNKIILLILLALTTNASQAGIFETLQDGIRIFEISDNDWTSRPRKASNVISVIQEREQRKKWEARQRREEWEWRQRSYASDYVPPYSW